MSRARKAPASAWGKLYASYIARLQKLGAVFCVECHAYLAPTHDCRAFEPVYLPMPREAYTFAADREVA